MYFYSSMTLSFFYLDGLKQRRVQTKMDTVHKIQNVKVQSTQGQTLLRTTPAAICTLFD